MKEIVSIVFFSFLFSCSENQKSKIVDRQQEIRRISDSLIILQKNVIDHKIHMVDSILNLDYEIPQDSISKLISPIRKKELNLEFGINQLKHENDSLELELKKY